MKPAGRRLPDEPGTSHPRGTRGVGGFVLAGGAALAIELALCLARGFDWFLRGYEPVLFVLGALWLPVALCALGFAHGRLTRVEVARLGWLRSLVGLVLAGLGAWAGVALTAGRWARAWPLRWPFVLTLAVLLAVLPAVTRAALHWLGRSRRRSTAGGLAALGVAAVCGALDLWVLPRAYLPLHLLLSFGALWALACAGVLLERPWPARWLRRGVPLAAALALVGLVALTRSYNAGYVIEHAAPWTGKLLGLLEPLGPARPAVSESDPEDPVHVQGKGIDLRDADVLLVTVDALRADVLGAYGGRVETPAMDALAAEGMVFERAYTPTPHTSYALSSMLTGKPLREVMALSEGATDHRSLPEMLRRFGYRTAAFFPPAIFFVDGARFERLAERNFGFEYLKRMYASARQRVGQVQRYLRKAAPDKPVFVWVHLFEPHEPYAAPEGEAESDQPRHRYEAEVRYVDHAIGELVHVFRTQRPGATVVLSADHGEEFDDHGGLYHGTTLYDEQARVPLIWSSPGVVAPGRSFAPVELHDIPTTLLAAAGIARDARMRGDDLGDVLAGSGDGPDHAFASIDGLAMVADRRYKALCETGGGRCRLFDLKRDPHERENLAGREPERLARLTRALDAHLSSIAREEALPLGVGVGFPEALSRARLGAPGAATALVPMLASDRAEIRSQAARTLGELGHQGARMALARLHTDDPDADVRREAALASCRLGDRSGCDATAEVLAVAEPGSPLARRAARTLAHASRHDGVQELIGWMADPEAEERDRVAALSSLRELEEKAAEPALIALLDDVRLRPLAAEALGELGSKAGADALAKQLARERYPPARTAEVRALLALHDARAVPLLLRMLGTDSGVPSGVALLAEAGTLTVRPSRLGGLLARGSDLLVGAWRCAEVVGGGCVPGTGAALGVPRSAFRGPLRVVLWTRAPRATTLEAAGQVQRVPAGDGQVALSLAAAPSALSLSAADTVEVRAMAVVPAREDVPPPPPEPWDDGAE